MLETFPPAMRELLERLATDSGDNSVMLPFEIWRDVFINDADFETARWSYGQLSSEPFQQLLEPLDLKKF
jgi:hypothetical protein